jgi:hypothetical protein
MKKHLASEHRRLDMPASATGWSEPVLQARVAPAEIQRIFSAHFIAK